MSPPGEPTPASEDLGSSPSDDLLRELARTVDAPPPDLRAGDRLDRFCIVRPIGRGGMGAVYLAKDERLARTVALKVLHPRSLSRGDRRKRFLREARAAAAVDHPEVARILEVGEVEGRVFLVFEHVVGRTLRARLDEGPVPWAEAVTVGQALCRALEAAHGAGVVHRDLKPENVMLTDGGGLKVLDFGLAQRLAPSALPGASGEPAGSDVATVAGQVLGSPGYMSPEQALGSGTDHRTDLFSLGVVLFELVAGRRPFHGQTAMETLVATSRDRAPDVRRFAKPTPAPLARTIARCLETDRERRPASARAVLRELERVTARRAPPSVALAGVATLAALGLGGGMFVFDAAAPRLASTTTSPPSSAGGEVSPGDPVATGQHPGAEPGREGSRLAARSREEDVVGGARAPSASSSAAAAASAPPAPASSTRRGGPTGSATGGARAPTASPAPDPQPAGGATDWRRDPSFAEQK